MWFVTKNCIQTTTARRFLFFSGNYIIIHTCIINLHFRIQIGDRFGSTVSSWVKQDNFYMKALYCNYKCIMVLNVLSDRCLYA